MDWTALFYYALAIFILWHVVKIIFGIGLMSDKKKKQKEDEEDYF